MMDKVIDPIAFPPDPLGKDRPPRCMGCGYVLQGLAHEQCPECGRAFAARVPSTFSRVRPYRALQYWWPGVLFALAGTLMWAAVFYLNHALGWGLFIGVPWTLGAMIGYSRRRYRGVSKAVGLVLAGVSVVFLIGMLMIGGFAGVFCAVILLVIYIPLAWVGVMVGVVMARMFAELLANSNFPQREHLPLVLLLLAPGLLHGAEVLFGPAIMPTTVQTTGIIDATPDRAYRAQLFYAELEDRPSLLMRLGQPRPVGVDGRLEAVGDVVHCRYTKDGLMTVRATEARPGQRLSFDVIAQKRIEDHSATLIAGRFDFEPVGADQTRVTITSHYQPKLTPRVMWKPIESLFGHAMHEELLEGMQQRIDEQRDHAAK